MKMVSSLFSKYVVKSTSLIPTGKIYLNIQKGVIRFLKASSMWTRNPDLLKLSDCGKILPAKLEVAICIITHHQASCYFCLQGRGGRDPWKCMGCLSLMGKMNIKYEPASYSWGGLI